MYVYMKILVIHLQIGSFFLKKDQHKSNSTTILLLNTAIFNRFDIVFPANPKQVQRFSKQRGTWGTHQESYKVGGVRGRYVMAAFCGKVERWKGDPVSLHPGRFTWNLQITHLERKMIFQTSMIKFHVKFQGSTLS